MQLDKGTASYRKSMEYQKMKEAGMDFGCKGEESSSNSTKSDTTEGAEESDFGHEKEDLEGEYWEENEPEELHQEGEEGNWWDSPLHSESD